MATYTRAKPKGRYRSTYEYNVAKNGRENKLGLEYEKLKLPYTVPEVTKTYTPDFTLPNGLIIECKGRFTPADRKKMMLVKASHPDKDIRLLFQNASVKLSKNSTTTYGIWASRNGFDWAEGMIPPEWSTEE